MKLAATTLLFVVLAAMAGCAHASTGAPSVERTQRPAAAASTPASLPPGVEEGPDVSSMTIGQTAYVDWFSVSQDEHNHYWIDPSFVIYDQPHDDATMRIERRADGLDAWAKPNEEFYPKSDADTDGYGKKNFPVALHR